MFFKNPTKFTAPEMLAAQYKNVGRALRGYEKSKNQDEFQTEVSFVPTEVLEAYLNDLLDLSVNPNELFIYSPRGYRWLLIGSILGLILTIIIAACISFTTESLFLTFLSVTIAMLPTVVVASIIVKQEFIRRGFFAKTLSREIQRRRGTYKGLRGDRYLAKIQKLITKKDKEALNPA